MQIDSENPTSLQLSAALLIYKTGGSHGQIAVTRHKIADGEIQPGEAIDVAAVKQLLDGTPANEEGAPRISANFTWISARILAESADRIVWWTEPGVRTIFVAGKPVSAWFPSLVWAGHKARLSLYMWSCAGSKCPTAKTVVYRPRFGPVDGTNHIHSDCAVCLGTMSPKRLTPNGWMESFYDTNFKTKDGLPLKPYEPQKTHKKVGTLESELTRISSRSTFAD